MSQKKKFFRNQIRDRTPPAYENFGEDDDGYDRPALMNESSMKPSMLDASQSNTSIRVPAQVAAKKSSVVDSQQYGYTYQQLRASQVAMSPA